MSNMKKYLELGTKQGKKLVCIDTWMYLEYDGTTPADIVYVHLTGGSHRIKITGAELDTGIGIVKVLEDAMADAYASSWLKVVHPVVVPDSMLVDGTEITSLSMQLLP